MTHRDAAQRSEIRAALRERRPARFEPKRKSEPELATITFGTPALARRFCLDMAACGYTVVPYRPRRICQVQLSGSVVRWFEHASEESARGRPRWTPNRS